MTARRPLVRVGGRVLQLPAGDTLDGPSAALIRAPIPIEPLNGGDLVGEKPTLLASPFAPLYSVDSRNYRRFQVALSSDPSFTAPVFSVDVNADSVVVGSGLVVSASYVWRCKDVSTSGDESDWSVAQTMTTKSTFNNYIDTPNPTPAIGAPFEGGFYMGMFWNHIAQSSDSKVLAVGAQTFTVADMSATPIVYAGQVVEVRSRDNPANRFKGVVTGASGTTLTLNVTSIEGNGTFSDWSVMARFRNIVAPKSSGENASIAIKNANTALPTGCQTLTEGLFSTNLMADAASATTYPAAHWARSLTIGGYTDWHIPARDVLELCWRNAKAETASNYITPNRGVGFDYKKDGSFGDTSTNHGVNNNSDPVGVAYTTSVPSQTSITAFKESGAEAFTYNNNYRTSSEFSETTMWGQRSYSGGSGRQESGLPKDSLYYCRAVRRSII